MGNIRKYKTYTISRFVSKPVMFWGLPLKLSFVYLSFFVFFVMLAMIMTSFDVPVLIVGIVAGGLGVICTTGVHAFYKKYGLKGFQQQRRNAKLSEKIEANMSVNEILRKKIKD